jgi:hypothetical protein
VIGRNVYVKATEGSVRQQLPVSTTFDQRFKTDDRGVYRIYGLPASRFIVSVQGDAPSRSTWIFHPGVTEEAQAGQIDVVAGRVIENVDIKLPPITRVYGASGRVVDQATGKPVSKIRLGWGMLVDNHTRSFFSANDPLSDEQGVFHILNLATGRYAVYVPMNSRSEYYSDELVFELTDQDVTGLEIRARPAASLSGVVVIEGSRDPSVLSELQHLVVSVGRHTGGPEIGASATVGADGRFRIPGLPPDRFLFYLSSETPRRRFSLSGVERDGVRLPDWIEVADGEQVTGLRVIVAYNAGVVRGQVQIVGGTLPEGSRLRASSRRADLPGQPSYAPVVTVDAAGRFLIDGLATGVHEISLMVFVPSKSGGRLLSPLRPPVRQSVSVTSGAESEVTFTLDLNAPKVKEEK